MDNGALIPELEPLESTPEDVEETEDNENRKLVASDEQLASLIGHPGYARLEDRLNHYIDQFRTGKGMAFDKDTPLEVIGQKYVVASTIANICEELKEMVDNAANSVAISKDDHRGK